MQNFGTLRQFLNLPPCPPKYVIVRGIGGSTIFCLIKASLSLTESLSQSHFRRLQLPESTSDACHAGYVGQACRAGQVGYSGHAGHVGHVGYVGHASHA